MKKNRQQEGSISKVVYVCKRVRKKLGELKDDCKVLNLNGRMGSGSTNEENEKT